MVDDGVLAERIALVTGASAGIGEAIAMDLAEQGARVVINARRKERLDALADRIGVDRVAVVPGDAAYQAVIDAMFEAAVTRFGSAPDLVVVNAGRGLAGGLIDSDDARWEAMIRINLLGAARLMRTAARRLLEMDPDSDRRDWRTNRRDIVVMGSNVGRHISPFSSVYGSTKFAVNSLAEALRRELGPKGVRVSLIEPGIVRSEFQASAGYDPDEFGRFMDSVGPVLEPVDVARLVTFIVSQPMHVHVSDALIRPTRQDYP